MGQYLFHPPVQKNEGDRIVSVGVNFPLENSCVSGGKVWGLRSLRYHLLTCK